MKLKNEGTTPSKNAEKKPVKKRGRKPKKMYFGEQEEAAVVRFLEAKTQDERDRIYNEYLKAPLTKMVESIIRKYKLYRKNVEYEDLHADTLSHLITKTHKFDPSKGKKAYSYYGTVCKNYILYLLQTDEKLLKKNISYEDIYDTIEQDEKYSYELETGTSYLGQLVNDISSEIKKELTLNEEGELKKPLNQNEVKVGLAVVQILDNWEVMFENLDDNDKYNKNTFYATVREYTGLQTKDIRNSLKRYKKLYNMIKASKIEEDLL